MSHLTDGKLKIRHEDLDLLEQVLAEHFSELELRRGKTRYNWYGRWVNDYHGSLAAADQGWDPKTFGRCAHAIGFRDSRSAYEIGLVDDGAGHYHLLYDAWGSGGRLTQACGAGLGRLKQEHAVAITERRYRATLARKGFALERENLASGRIRLRFRKR